MKAMDIGTLKNMLSMMGASLPEPVAADNLVAEFVERELHLLMPADIDTEILDIFQGVYVGAANKDPNGVLKTLVRIHNDVGELVQSLQALDTIANTPTGETQIPDAAELGLPLPELEGEPDPSADLELP